MPSDSQYLLGPNPAWEFVFVSFTGELARSYCRQILERNGPILHFAPDSPPAWPLFEVLRLRWHSEHPPWTEISALLHLFVGRLIELTEPDRSEADGAPVQRAVAYVRQHFAEKSLNVERLADVAELTRSHFSYLFREQTGQSPAEFIREFRIGLAQELLAGSRAPLKQVADQVGFGSVAHFCSIFKRHTGVSPGEFRRYQTFAGAKSDE
jgi:AraC-like DNA-binding protein